MSRSGDLATGPRRHQLRRRGATVPSCRPYSTSSEVACLRLSHLAVTEKRAYVLAGNKPALNAGGDKEPLAIERRGLIEADYQVDVAGFSISEVDAVLQEAREASPLDLTLATTSVPSHRPLP